MSPKALFPPGSDGVARVMALSPGILSHGHVFVTGMTGSAPDGQMPEDPETQFRNAFAKVEAVLAEAGLDLGDVVAMTSYHRGIDTHFDLFNATARTLLSEPFPAWTAVEVAGLRRQGALVEIRVIAATKGEKEC